MGGHKQDRCKHGHRLTEANVYVSADGKKRECKQCSKARVKKARGKK